VASPDELGTTLSLGGPRIVVVRTDQRAEARLGRELRAAAAGALRE
jgi:2-succinyl-5-enolpyruvyl-6-hydroxy-3-cyclohexene-1-carboxylate synthase